MPTVLRIGPFRFFFYSGDGVEPPHVHVSRDADEAKYWLDPVRLERYRGFTPKELRTLEQMVLDNRDELTEAWNDFFGP